ncbi:MAG: ferritin family protein [Sedimentisphaerales bacterium]|nr:ferritin family protein [Sedimentisphaerales bacterium]
MRKLDSFEDIIDFAIQNEIEANQFYKDMAKQMKNPGMREVFEGFAEEELGHKKKLESIKQSKSIQPAQNIVDLQIADYVVEVESGPDMDYQDALVLAMKNEKAAFRLYLDLANKVTNEDQKSLFLSLANEEAKHKLRFEIEYDEIVLKEN